MCKWPAVSPREYSGRHMHGPRSDAHVEREQLKQQTAVNVVKVIVERHVVGSLTTGHRRRKRLTDACLGFAEAFRAVCVLQ